MLKSIDLCLNSNFFSKIEQSCPLLSRTMDTKVFFVNIFYKSARKHIDDLRNHGC